MANHIKIEYADRIFQNECSHTRLEASYPYWDENGEEVGEQLWIEYSFFCWHPDLEAIEDAIKEVFSKTPPNGKPHTTVCTGYSYEPNEDDQGGVSVVEKIQVTFVRKPFSPNCVLITQLNCLESKSTDIPYC